MRQILFIFSIIFAVQACTVEESQLGGNWQATAFYENGQSTQIPLDSVRLTFSPDQRYHFQTLGFYSESGRWKCTGKYLVLTDTTTNQSVERLLKVLYQSQDSLKIKMEHNGKEQVLFFGRQ